MKIDAGADADILVSAPGTTSIYRLCCIIFLILLISFAHYITPQNENTFHILYRELYFFPVILAGFWFGTRGGLIASLVVAVLYVPLVIWRPDGFISHNPGNILEVFLFIIVGLLVGWLRKREAAQFKARKKEHELAAMGKAVACIAHDMKTPLTIIGGLARQVRRNLEEDDRAAGKLEIVEQQALGLEILVDDMLTFAKPLELNLQVRDLNECIQDTVLISREKSKKHGVDLSFQPETGSLPCSYDAYRLQRALLNLVNNGIEASPSGTEVIVRSRAEQHTVIIEVEDQGSGISRETVETILQPFVSTKKEGTGLGLPIVKKIIEAHDGSLHFEKGKECGMIFRLRLSGKSSIPKESVF